MHLFDDYSSELDEVYKQNPVIRLQEIYGDELKVEALSVIKLLVTLKNKWEEYKKHEVKCIIIMDESETGETDLPIGNHNFMGDFDKIIQLGDYKSVNYRIDSNGFIISKEFLKNNIQFQQVVDRSKTMKKVCFFMGVNGIDLIVNGILFDSDNRLDSYSDIISFRHKLDVSQYRKLLEKFFFDRVQYDTFKQFFIQKSKLPKSLHGLLEKHPKLLDVKPEERFQNELEYFLKQNCIGRVLTEVRNKLGERYDVWVATSDDNLFVFEIKWLGKSITAEGNIFSQYNTHDRAIEGAYQLKKYIDDSDKYASILEGQFRIYCGVLVTFDARLEMEDIIFPEEFKDYPQLDLNQHFRIDKKNVPASQIYKKMVK